MKSLFTYLEDCVTATPANTMGTGSVSLPDGDQVGADGAPTAKALKQKKKKRKKTTEDTIIDL